MIPQSSSQPLKLRGKKGRGIAKQLDLLRRDVMRNRIAGVSNGRIQMVSEGGTTIQVNGRSGGGSVRQIPFTLTAAGVTPTEAEIETGIEDAYTSRSLTPQAGDVLYHARFRYEIRGEKNVDNNSISANSVWRVTFQIGGVEYIAHGVQLGLY